ncbi:MAG: DNA adenine methylase [Succinivibrio sp.]
MHTPNGIKNLKPFVKWVGGKSTSLDRLLSLFPEKITNYVEPFVGSGAVFFSLNFDKAIISDTNQELIYAYQVIKENVFELEMYLQTLIYDKTLYEKIRAWDREKNYQSRSKLERAARLIYLMKTCYNGLYRVSKKNYFNTPMGNYKDPTICDTDTLNACSAFLNQKDVDIRCCDYATLADEIDEDSFVYLDPPYFPVSKTANFTSYQSGQFAVSEQHRLFDFCLSLHKRGIRFLLSNSDVPEARELYKGFHIETIEVSRRINSVSSRRNAVNELAIMNYSKDSGELISI